jgi:hypothetical protein
MTTAQAALREGERKLTPIPLGLNSPRAKKKNIVAKKQ